jgi:hypothetical protein
MNKRGCSEAFDFKISPLVPALLVIDPVTVSRLLASMFTFPY